MTIGKYSFGVGDRFAREGVNQLQALLEAEQRFGVHFDPVWNKSNREHQIVGTEPSETRAEADAAVKALNYKGRYFVDADHINLGNVDRFIEASDFFTIDVADYIGKTGSVEDRFLPAIREAGRIYRHIAERKGADTVPSAPAVRPEKSMRNTHSPASTMMAARGGGLPNQLMERSVPSG